MSRQADDFRAYRRGERSQRRKDRGSDGADCHRMSADPVYFLLREPRIGL